MTKTQQVSTLYSEISRQNSYYMAAIGTLVAVIIGLFVFIAFVQLRLSQKEINKIEEDLTVKFSSRFDFIKSTPPVTTVNGWRLDSEHRGFKIFENKTLIIIEADLKIANQEGQKLYPNEDIMVDSVSNAFGISGKYQFIDNTGTVINVEASGGRWKLLEFTEPSDQERYELNFSHIWIRNKVSERASD